MNIIRCCVIAVYTLIWLSFYHSVLVSDTDQLKISDFGMSRAFGDKCTWVRFAGTVAWMALGMIQEESCSEKVDIRLHLDIAAQEFIKINPAVYLESQVHTMTVYRHDMIKLFTE